MTTLAVAPDRWSYGGLDLSSYAYLVREVSGADEFPKLRGEDAPFTGLPGRRPMGKLPDARRLALGLWVAPLTAAGTLVEPTNRRQARKNLDELYTVLGRRAQQALVRTLPDASSRTAMAEVVDVSGFTDSLSGELFGLVVDFALADPYLYGADVVLSGATPASPTDLAVTHPGTVRGGRLVLDFTGPIANPRVTNLGNGQYVEALVTVASARHLLIDVSAFTASNDGANAIGSIRHSGAYRFLELDPGAQTLRVSATTPGGSLAVTFSPPYL
jgi:hypothetical protein